MAYAPWKKPLDFGCNPRLVKLALGLQLEGGTTILYVTGNVLPSR